MLLQVNKLHSLSCMHECLVSMRQKGYTYLAMHSDDRHGGDSGIVEWWCGERWWCILVRVDTQGWLPLW